MKVFPTCLFAPDDVNAFLERRTISGGQALTGDEDIIATDGGGRVVIEFTNPFLDDPDVALAWRALDALMDGGVVPIIVPICDARHQPTNGPVTVPHSDGTTFSDATEYMQGDASGEIAADAPLRATTLHLKNLILARPLLGGEWFTIVHPTMRERAYRIAEIVEYDAGAGTATIKFRAPLREAVTTGEAVYFFNPRCVCRLQGEMPSPSQMGLATSSGARFVEDFSGSYS